MLDFVFVVWHYTSRCYGRTSCDKCHARTAAAPALLLLPIFRLLLLWGCPRRTRVSAFRGRRLPGIASTGGFRCIVWRIANSTGGNEIFFSRRMALQMRQPATGRNPLHVLRETVLVFWLMCPCNVVWIGLQVPS